MAELEELYPLQWFRNRVRSRKGPHRSSLFLAELIYDEFHPASVIDLGAGTCAFANRMGQLGVYSVAVDGSAFNREFAESCTYVAADLSKPWPLGPSSYDLVTSWDVIEHIPAEAEQVIVDTVVGLAGQWICLSIDASRWGRHHVNCKAKGYWRTRFSDAGLIFEKQRTADVAERILRDPNITSNWYANNLSIFRRPE